jgi:hypothetical protein
MAFKTTIGPKGVVTERIDGSADQFVLDVEAPRGVVNTVVSGAGTIDVTGGTYIFIAPVTVTASLPAITSDNVGSQVTLLKDANATTMLVTSSNSINSVTAAVVMSSSFGVLDLVSVPSNNNGSFHWHVLRSTLPV